MTMNPAPYSESDVAWPEGYVQHIPAERRAQDAVILSGLRDGDVHAEIRPGEPTATLTLYVAGGRAELGEIMPILSSLGMDVLEQLPWHLVSPEGLEWSVLEFEVRPRHRMDAAAATRCTDAIRAAWEGAYHPDALGELITTTPLGWEQVTVLQAYVEYLAQVGFPLPSRAVRRVLRSHPQTTSALMELFTARFLIAERSDDEVAARATVVQEQIDAVEGLDDDRALRALSAVVQATVRTNFAVPGRGALAFKIDVRELPFVMEPRPLHEIFVVSPEIAGVHLRFGDVARGGLRWSDRRDDFRTEILGLVKAQTVKNAVIVPAGAKGGFVLRNPPEATGDAARDRARLREAGTIGYRQFVTALLEVTDDRDRTTGTVTAPANVVCWDEADPYLVVAADKGTASFSDIANEIAESRGFWLGDAFASGGSTGFDHKGLGITARGAWVSVRRRFREMGIDPNTEPITAVGIGDMSGDVFGNGMLLSRTLKLVAAFDHRHIFVDPDPDPEVGFAERERLFALSGSSWADYDASLISSGGGVWARDVKQIPASTHMRTALGLDDEVTQLSPPELIRAVLCAPVDLFWNGGIGTYVKAGGESHAEVGDKADDAVRVDGSMLRARVVAEGGNLGFTQAGRIEFARGGGRIGTDALDNSAGVDISDHEVNLKILLDQIKHTGAIGQAERNQILADVSDEVASQVLADNYAQNEAVGTAQTETVELLPVYSRQLDRLEAAGALNRVLEGLPTAGELEQRQRSGDGLETPGLATLLAHVKLNLKSHLLAGGLPDDEVFLPLLRSYFPRRLADQYPDQIAEHPLRREIVATVLTNQVVDQGGISYTERLAEQAGASIDDTVRAYVIVVRVFDLPRMWAAIAEAGLPADVSDSLILLSRRLLDRAARWWLDRRPQPLDITAEIDRFAGPIAELRPHLTEWLGAGDLENLDARSQAVIDRGAPAALVRDVELLLDTFGLLDAVEIARRADLSAARVARTYFHLTDRLGIVPILNRITGLDRSTAWASLARVAVREDVYASVRDITAAVLAHSPEEEDPAGAFDAWARLHTDRLRRADDLLARPTGMVDSDLAVLTVSARQLRRLAG